MPDARSPEHSSYCIALQPICDSSLRHVADELLYRATGDASNAVIDDPITATARVCNTAFYETGVKALSGNRRMFFNAPRDWLIKPELMPEESERIVIEVLESVQGDAEVVNALRELRSRGYTIALDDFVLTPQTRPLLELADIIKIDVLETDVRSADIDHYLSRDIILLAEKVEDWKTFESCRKRGFTLFQGYFYARPTARKSTTFRGGQNLRAQLPLLNALKNPQVTFLEVEQLLRQDPYLCVRLLRMANSAQFRRAVPITSIKHTLNLLGLNRLHTLIITLMLANDEPASLVQLPEVLTCAAMCEKLASHDFNADPDAAFMAGLLLKAGPMLGMSLKEFCEEPLLSVEIREALINRTGELGKILRLVQMFEHAQLHKATPKSIARLNTYFLECRQWANDVLAGLED
jgi:EAL and modified HD-GYP domain-containing signal transduction protein